jgi:hypothetical protein
MRDLIIGIIFMALVWGLFIYGIKNVGAHHYMCDYQPQGQLTVWMWPGVNANGITYADLEESVAYWPNLTLTTGHWWEADILVHVYDGPTWVHTPCTGLEPRGNSKAIVFVGPDIRDWLTHELGHSFGLADHVPPYQQRPGHVNPGPCLPGNIMSYC